MNNSAAPWLTEFCADQLEILFIGLQSAQENLTRVAAFINQLADNPSPAKI